LTLAMSGKNEHLLSFKRLWRIHQKAWKILNAALWSYLVGSAAFIGESMAIGELYNSSNHDHRQPLDLVLRRIVIISWLVIHVVTAALLSKKGETTYKFLLRQKEISRKNRSSSTERRKETYFADKLTWMH
jgi:hypothetical protein